MALPATWKFLARQKAAYLSLAESGLPEAK